MCYVLTCDVRTCDVLPTVALAKVGDGRVLVT
jgi:hypothetical protein